MGWQAVVVAAIALLIGIPSAWPSGGRRGAAVATSIPLVYVGPISPRVLVLVVPAALAALLALAAAPGLAGGAPATAATLRAE